MENLQIHDNPGKFGACACNGYQALFSSPVLFKACVQGLSTRLLIWLPMLHWLLYFQVTKAAISSVRRGKLKILLKKLATCTQKNHTPKTFQEVEVSSTDCSIGPSETSVPTVTLVNALDFPL